MAVGARCGAGGAHSAAALEDAWPPRTSGASAAISADAAVLALAALATQCLAWCHAASSISGAKPLRAT
eukprot:10494437-Lingulodinium_polyedra.AAC.1